MKSSVCQKTLLHISLWNDHWKVVSLLPQRNQYNRNLANLKEVGWNLASDVFQLHKVLDMFSQTEHQSLINTYDAIHLN